MNRSTPPGKMSHHHTHTSQAAAATASLPFSIDHILSSPIKQAAVQAAVNQQQAAAMMMMNTSQDSLVSTAMLNEQLALLSQQQHHLLNPTALAAAAAAAAAGAQQHQHWQHQQQLMAAAAAANLAAAQQQQQTALSPLNNPLAATSAPNLQSSPNFLSYFMACMLLQQQQQQQQPQQHQQQQHQLHQLAQNQSSSHLHPNRSSNNHLGGINSHSTNNGMPSNKQLLHAANKNSVYDSIAALTIPRSSPVSSSHSSGRESRQREVRLSLSPPQGGGFSNKPTHIGANTTTTATSATNSANNINTLSTNKQNKSSAKAATTTNSDQSTALSSLSNFVTESLAPILNSDHHNKSSNYKDHTKLFRSSAGSFNSTDFFNKSNSPTIGGASSKTVVNNHHHHHSSKQQHSISGNNGNISQHRKSGSIEPEEARNNNNDNTVEIKGDLQNRSTLDLISSAAQALKSTGTTINTTLAKAPPELVQKQPAWVFCTRYSDRPSSGPRTRRAKSKDKKAKDPKASTDEKRPRTAFTSEQLEKLRQEFQANSYLDERRRKDLAERLCLNENQIKIWFQNKRAKMKKQNNQPNPLRGLLVAGGLYNHSTATSDCSESYANGNDNEDDDDDDDENESGQLNNGGSGVSSNKRRRDQEDDDGNLRFKNEDDTGMRQGSAANKRARMTHSGSESGSESSRIDDLDEDERVISVS